MERPARFITFEGIDGCGKTTQIRKLSEYLSTHHISHVVEREPGSTALGGALRRILKNPETVYAFMNVAFKDKKDFTPLPIEQERTSESELFLFLAARAEYVHHVVAPRLQADVSVLSDRFLDSTIAYQGGGLLYKQPDIIPTIIQLHRFILGGVRMPDLTLCLDISFEEMQRRARSQKQDFIERRGKDYFERVRNTYLHIARKNSDRVVLIDGAQSIDAIFEKGILPHVRKLYNLS
ncbi:MAG: dTMP kinase [Nanoarchaeota archaeon]